MLLSGDFYRIVFRHDLPRLLNGAITREGRFHHCGQPAIYVSPSPEAAAHAVASYLRPGDPDRVVAVLALAGAKITDLRDPDTLARLGLHGGEASTPWQPQRAQGVAATSWLASDAARQSGADGMIYTARSNPDRWHLVVFRWNEAEAPTLTEKPPF